MIYFQLPKTFYNIYNKIACTHTTNDAIDSSISNSLSFYLYDIKEKINKYEKEWDIYKKYTNPYEYIHTPSPVNKKCISKYKPLSRSYFKMIEIVNLFGLTMNQPTISTFHLAEGPGGFIEAMVEMRNCKNDKYIGMTILDEVDVNVPAWKKSDKFLKENTNVIIETGIDMTGDILKIENFDYCVKKYGSSMDLITGDGGFDFSVNFNQQEQNVTKLLFAQMCFALCMQKRDGVFILKLFDCFIPSTIDILYILSSFYKKVYITKPQTSRYANSEKYIVCKYFILNENKNKLYNLNYHTLGEYLLNFNFNLKHEKIRSLIDSDTPCYFINKINDINTIIGQQQLESLHQIINILNSRNKNDKIELMKKTNIQKCVNWCEKFKLPCNKFTEKTNMFLPVSKEHENSKYNISNIFANELNNDMNENNSNVDINFYFDEN
jgi:23S rRNA U2552 (ribose-2'-O)-methylase RlmE/FtsJ